MNITLCPAGLTLLRQAVAGLATLNFTALQLGNGVDAGDEATTLSNPMLTLSLNSVAIGDTFISLHAAFSNTEIDSGFRATEIGVLARDGDEGEEILYAYLYAGESASDYIPAASERSFEGVYDVEVYIGDAQNVTAAVSQSLEYVTKAVFEEFTARRDNPHAVTAEQVGLGNVANKSESMIAPHWNVVTDTVEEIRSGEMLSQIFSKLQVAVRSLISHLRSTTNPHNVTAAQVGAARSTHYHDASAITGGILGDARGGTGCATAAAAALKYLSALLDMPTAKYDSLNRYLSDGFFKVRSSDDYNPLRKEGYLLVFKAGSHTANGTTYGHYRQIYLCTDALATGEQKIYTRLMQGDGTYSPWL